MRKKYTAVICVIAILFTSCAYSSDDIAELSEEQKSEAEVGAAEQETEQDIEREEILSDNDNATSIQARELFETFINEEYAGIEDYSYAMYDEDGDGCEELYINRGVLQSFYIVTYMNGGLCIEYQKEIPFEIDGLQWIDTETLAKAQDGDMVHSGIYVYVQRDDRGERYWYPSEKDFVEGNGFGEAEPFFEYSVPDGQKILTLYYDEVAQKGCGIRYYERDPSTFITTGMYGFVFEGLGESKESGIREDYLKPESVDGTDGSDEVEDLKENTEYDDEGRITHYDATGILTFLEENDTEPRMVLWIDYEYYDNGLLKSRLYRHNGYIFGTWYTAWDCFFDIQGRIAYEDIYITHGSWDIYYIYMDETKEPAYILNLDNNVGEWIPEFRKGK